MCNLDQNYDALPTIYAITPTYSRHVQKAELTRLSHTLLLVPNLHWVVVEDSTRQTDLVSNFLQRLNTEFNFKRITHLYKQTPDAFKLKPGEATWSKPKGIWQRNKALRWLRDNHEVLDQKGIVYFVDDDNTYDLTVFDEMRDTRKVSVWPVAFVGGLLVEKPIIESGKVHAFNSMWKSERPFPFDMAGFAINLRLLLSKPSALFSEKQEVGYVESHFLSQFVTDWTELEPKADNCTKILVWHTRTQKPALHEERKLVRPSNYGMA